MTRPTELPHPDRTALTGGLAALSAFLLWGLMPVYFKALGTIPPVEILAHRIVWSVLLVGLIALLLHPVRAIVLAVGDRRRFGVYLLTALLISGNWLVFLWAVMNGRLVEVSLGYYINPLVNVLLGVVFLAERLSRPQLLAVFVAFAGVFSLVIDAGTVPWLGLYLGVSFGLYALVRKKAGIDPLLGLLIETAVLTPPALGYLLWLGAEGTGAFGGRSAGTDLLLAAAGVVTSVPLVLFMIGNHRLRLSTIGLMQYVAPSCQLALAVICYGEAFTVASGFAFACIWIGLAIFSWDLWRRR
jgi:chloramphenicol-sensitive protein RarD